MATAKEEVEHSQKECTRMMIPVKDALEILSGKWKLPIIISLMLGTKRFKQISKDVNGITDRVLSKELKELEMNQLITRTVYDAFPPKVEYSLTRHGKSLHKVLDDLREWGLDHRRKILGK